MTEYGIPYMGSKRALAKDIIHFIRQHNPKAKYLYDIFGGGGSVSFEALQQGFEKVYYVDLDKGMCLYGLSVPTNRKFLERGEGAGRLFTQFN